MIISNHSSKTTRKMASIPWSASIRSNKQFQYQRLLRKSQPKEACREKNNNSPPKEEKQYYISESIKRSTPRWSSLQHNQLFSLGLPKSSNKNFRFYFLIPHHFTANSKCFFEIIFLTLCQINFKICYSDAKAHEFVSRSYLRQFLGFLWLDVRKETRWIHVRRFSCWKLLYRPGNVFANVKKCGCCFRGNRQAFSFTAGDWGIVIYLIVE